MHSYLAFASDVYTNTAVVAVMETEQGRENLSPVTVTAHRHPFRSQFQSSRDSDDKVEEIHISRLKEFTNVVFSKT